MKQDVMKFLAITKNVYIKNTVSWGFLTMVLSPLLFVALGVFIQLYTPNPSDYTVAVISNDSDIRETFIETQPLPWGIDTQINTIDEAQNSLIAEDIDGIIDIQIGDSVTVLLTQTNGLFDDEQKIIEEGVNKTRLVTDYNIEIPETTSTIQHVRIEQGQLISGDIAEYRLQQGFVMIASIGLVLLLTNYASSILSEIASEKGTRMMEIILSATHAHIHLLGKLAGIILVMLTQFSVYAIPVVALFFVGQDVSSTLYTAIGTRHIWSAIQPVFWLTTLFTAAGLVLYVTLAALLGSLASRQEDAAKLITPISLLVLTGYMGSISISTGTEHPIFTVMAHIPFFSAQLVPLQVFHDHMTLTHAIGILVWCILFAVLLFVFTLATYKTNVLSYSDKSIKQTMLRSWTIMKQEHRLRTQRK